MGRREIVAPAIERGVVDRFGGIELCAHFAVGEVYSCVGFVVGDEVGPTEETRLARLIDFVVTAGASWSVISGIGTHVAPVEVAGFGIDGKLPRIATSHDVDFRTCSDSSGREEVPCGDFVGGIRLNFDANQTAAKIVRVTG